MSPSRENDWLIASDGIRARKNGAWGKEKLSFLNDFVPPALMATNTKVQRYYVDLFAGPGCNVDPDTKEEFDGSAIRVLPMTAPGNPSIHFTDAVLVNNDAEDQQALGKRVSALVTDGICCVPSNRVTFMADDANAVVGRIMKSIDPRAYALVFVDITRSSHLPWSTIRHSRHTDTRAWISTCSFLWIWA